VLLLRFPQSLSRVSPSIVHIPILAARSVYSVMTVEVMEVVEDAAGWTCPRVRLVALLVQASRFTSRKQVNLSVSLEAVAKYVILSHRSAALLGMSHTVTLRTVVQREALAPDLAIARPVMARCLLSKQRRRLLRCLVTQLLHGCF